MSWYVSLKEDEIHTFAVGKIKEAQIYKECIKCGDAPCEHDVSICIQGGRGVERFDGVEICAWFIENSMPIPEHFQQYEALARK